MNEEYKPSPDFVERVMARVYAYEAGRMPFFERLVASRPSRYVLACGGIIFGILKAVPAF